MHPRARGPCAGSNRAALVAAAGEAAFGWANLSLFTLRQNEVAFYDAAKTLPEVFSARDQGSYITLGRLRELAFPGKRALVWAHNGHIALRQELISTIAGPGGALVANPVAGVRDLGSFLFEEYGSGYAPIAQVALRVGVKQGVPLAGDSTYPYGGVNEATSPTSVERVLDAIGPRVLLAGADAAPFAAGKEHLLGDMQLVRAQQYRALLYAHESPPMQDPAP